LKGNRELDAEYGKALLATGFVKYIEPNYILSIDATPNDSRIGELWGLHNTGQTGGSSNADIDAPEAWSLTTGSSATVIGIVDTGINYTHPDLAANMWVNPG
jgi:subtilisin family serine protease